MAGYGLSSVHTSQARIAQMLRAYSAYVAAPKAFTARTLQDIESEGDAKVGRQLIERGAKELIPAKQIPSAGGLPADSVLPPLPTSGGMPPALMQKLVFPPGSVQL